MHFKRALIVFLLALSLCLSGCTLAAPEDDGRLRVAVTTDALYEMAAYIGGERAAVTKLVPDGVDLHDFEPRAKDVVSLGEADVLIINGLGLEPWIDGAMQASGSGLTAIDASAGVAPIHASDHDGEDDPHIWLSPVCAATMARNVMDALISADPDGEDVYTRNCADFTSKLSALHDEYAAIFEDADNHTLVTGHEIFAYLCRDFGLTQESAEGVFAEGEPSPQRLAELVDYCRANGITTVFAESGSSARIVETLARDANAEVVTIYTIESAEDGLTYLERMEYNLAAIAVALR